MIKKKQKKKKVKVYEIWWKIGNNQSKRTKRVKY